MEPDLGLWCQSQANLNSSLHEESSRCGWQISVLNNRVFFGTLFVLQHLKMSISNGRSHWKDSIGASYTLLPVIFGVSSKAWTKITGLPSRRHHQRRWWLLGRGWNVPNSQEKQVPLPWFKSWEWSWPGWLSVYISGSLGWLICFSIRNGRLSAIGKGGSVKGKMSDISSIKFLPVKILLVEQRSKNRCRTTDVSFS